MRGGKAAVRTPTANDAGTARSSSGTGNAPSGSPPPPQNGGHERPAPRNNAGRFGEPTFCSPRPRGTTSGGLDIISV